MHSHGGAAAKPYHHPADCREYLRQAVFPTLKAGIEQLLLAMEEDRIHMLLGKYCDEDGYLPEGWTPFQPMRWLGEWLLENNPKQASVQLALTEPHAGDGCLHKTLDPQ
ncbi:hypothetical protein WJX72_001931 [[Myrmecia] bisecta]|uniref:Uncharacterized protein n=1 Tax=[Myrmecia] bisecta TaxID=41462 RepID=A0AAW1R5I1_9CHLO